MTLYTVVKSKGKISQNFVAFSEYMNFTLNTVFGSIFYESIFIYKSQKKLWPHCASKLITTKLIVRFTYVIIIIKYAIDDSEWLSEQGTNAQRADIDNRVPYMCVADAKLSAV